MGTENIYSKTENKIYVKEIDENNSKSWVVKENGRENVYRSYSMLPEKVKRILSEKDEIKRKGPENGSFQLRSTNGRIEITENGRTEAYDSIDDVPEKYKEKIPDGLKMIDAMNKGKIEDVKKMVRDTKSNMSLDKYPFGRSSGSRQGLLHSEIDHKTVRYLVIFFVLAYIILRMLLIN